MKGWKTWAGAAIVAGAAVVEFLGYPEIAAAIFGIGVALGIVGIGHKVEKSK